MIGPSNCFRGGNSIFSRSAALTTFRVGSADAAAAPLVERQRVWPRWKATSSSAHCWARIQSAKVLSVTYVRACRWAAFASRCAMSAQGEAASACSMMKSCAPRVMSLPPLSVTRRSRSISAWDFCREPGAALAFIVPAPFLADSRGARVRRRAASPTQGACVRCAWPGARRAGRAARPGEAARSRVSRRRPPACCSLARQALDIVRVIQP